MRGRRRTAPPIRFSVLGKALGAVTLCVAVGVPVQLFGAGTAGAFPTINFVLTGNVSTGTATTTLSGTAFFDASVSPTAGSHLVSVQYDLLPQQPFCPPPITNPCPNVPVAQGTPTLYGWIGVWDTTHTNNGTYELEVFAEDLNASGTMYTDSSYGPITITVANPAPTTSVLIPSNGATLSRSTYLDASASNASGVEFRLFGGVYGYAAPLICTATQTIYGWLCGWNTTTVPNGSYILLSLASSSVGTAASSGVNITVNN
jgi:hypothetical protein